MYLGTVTSCLDCGIRSGSLAHRQLQRSD
jgi:hypothetical protein